MIFEENYFSRYILLTDQMSLSGFLYFLRYQAIMCIVIICFPDYDVINFKVNLSFLHDQKSQNKNLNISRAIRAFKMKLKIFFIVFKGLSVAINCLKLESGPLKIPC